MFTIGLIVVLVALALFVAADVRLRRRTVQVTTHVVLDGRVIARTVNDINGQDGRR